MIKYIIDFVIDNAFQPVWTTPILGATDDGFCSWLVSASGSKIIDIRYMSESKRFWQYGDAFEMS